MRQHTSCKSNAAIAKCVQVFLCIGMSCLSLYYAALLPRRGPHIASHSVCPSVCLSVRLSVRPSVCPSVRPVIITERHVAPPTNYNDTHVLFGRGPHIVRPSRPHKFLFGYEMQMRNRCIVTAQLVAVQNVVEWNAEWQRLRSVHAGRGSAADVLHCCRGLCSA